jgi:hypothetical protein
VAKCRTWRATHRSRQSDRAAHRSNLSCCAISRDDAVERSAISRADVLFDSGAAPPAATLAKRVRRWYTDEAAHGGTARSEKAAEPELRRKLTVSGRPASMGAGLRFGCPSCTLRHSRAQSAPPSPIHWNRGMDATQCTTLRTMPESERRGMTDGRCFLVNSAGVDFSRCRACWPSLSNSLGYYCPRSLPLCGSFASAFGQSPRPGLQATWK